MASILGLWQINANDSEGKLSLFLDNQGNLQGKMTFQDAPRVDDVTNVSWNDAAGEISFVRHLGQSGVTQTYTGFLGDGHADKFLYLAGFFTESDIPAGAPRTQYGWFARQPQPPARPSVTITGPFNVRVPEADLVDDPTDDEGPYDFTALGLQPPVTPQWTGGPGVKKITNPTASPTDIIFDMTGHTKANNRRTFQVSLQVTDQLGASASDQKTVTIDVTGSKGGAS